MPDLPYQDNIDRSNWLRAIKELDSDLIHIAYFGWGYSTSGIPGVPHVGDSTSSGEIHERSEAIKKLHDEYIDALIDVVYDYRRKFITKAPGEFERLSWVGSGR